jgi:hypothetical protein
MLLHASGTWGVAWQASRAAVWLLKYDLRKSLKLRLGRTKKPGARRRHGRRFVAGLGCLTELNAPLLH